jgi:hypothetical protein
MSETPSMTWQQPPTNNNEIKWNKKLRILIAAVILLSILFSVVAAILQVSGDTATTAQPTPTPTALPAEETAATLTERSVNIDKSDIELSIKILRKECHGSAGCDVTYRVVVDHVSTDGWPKTGDVYVTYQVTGPEDGPEYGTLSIGIDESYYEPWETVNSTRSRSVELTAKVTEVELVN